MRSLNVVSPHRSRQTIRIAIRQFDDLVFVIETQGGKHGTEDFFLRDLHVVVYAAKNSRFDKEAFPTIDRNTIPARDELRTLTLACFDVPENGLHLLLADQGTHPRFWIEWVAGHHLF